MKLGEGLKRVPGFGVLVDEDPDVAWRSLMRKIFELTEPKEAVAPIAGEKADVSNGHVNGYVNGAREEEKVEYSVEKLEKSLSEALLSTRTRMWPESLSMPADHPIVRCGTGPLMVREAEKLVATTGGGRETLRSAAISSSGKASGLWAYEVTLQNDHPSIEIGWCVQHTIKGEIHQDYARLQTKSGQFWFQGHKLAYTPPNLIFSNGDIISCFVDVDNMTFSYALNGVLLPLIRFHNDKDENDVSSPTPRTTASSSHASSSSSSDSTLKQLKNRNGQCEYSFKIHIGTHLKVSAALLSMQSAKLNFGQVPLFTDTNYQSIVSVDKMKVLESQCNLLLAIIDLVLPYMTAKSASHRHHPKSSPTRRQMASLTASTSSIPREKLKAVLDLVVNSDKVGLMAIFKDIDFDGVSSAGDSPDGYPSHSFVMIRSILPFLLRLRRKEHSQMAQGLIGAFCELISDESLSEAFWAHILSELGFKVSGSAQAFTPKCHELISIADKTLWADWMELLTTLVQNDKIYQVMTDAHLVHSILSHNFTMPILDHRIRIEPYIDPALLPLLDRTSPDEEYLRAFKSIRAQLEFRIDRLGYFAQILGSKWVKPIEEPSVEAPADSNVEKDKAKSGSPNGNSNGAEEANSSSHPDGSPSSGASSPAPLSSSPSPSTIPTDGANGANGEPNAASNPIPAGTESSSSMAPASSSPSPSASNGAPSSSNSKKRSASVTGPAATKLPANAFLMALRKLINSNSDCLRNKVVDYNGRAQVNGLFFALLSAIATSSAVKTTGIFANGLIGNTLLDPARSIVDRLGGTFGHVKTLHPDAFGDVVSELSQYPEVDFPDVATNWRFEFLDACQYFLHHSIVASIARVQEFSNSLTTSKRMSRNIATSRGRREADIEAGEAAEGAFGDLDMIDLVNQENTRHAALQCVMGSLILLDKPQLYLMHCMSNWVSQVTINLISHPTRSQLVNFFPEFYPQTLVILEHVFHIGELGSLAISFDIPIDENSILPPEDRDEDSTFPHRHGISTYALCKLLSKDLILNPNMQEFILNHFVGFVGWSIDNPARILSRKRSMELFDVFVMAFADAKKGFWSSIIGGMMSVLCGESETHKQYQAAFTSYVNHPDNVKKVEAMLNTVFNLISWAENELETHIDNFLEKLKLIASNVDTLIADPSRDPDFPDRPENRSGRAPPTEERGFKKSLAVSDWELVDAPNGGSSSDPRVLVVLPTDDHDYRVTVLRAMVLANVTGNNAFDVLVREMPAYNVVLMNLLLMLSQIIKHAPHLFESPLIMTRTCEAVGHSLRRMLDPSGSPPIVKLLRLFGRVIGPESHIKFKYTNNYDFWAFNAKKLVWVCISISSMLIARESTRPSFLQLLHGLLPNQVIDLSMQLEIRGLPEWTEQKAQFEAIKTTISREVLLRSNQEECPICYTNPVNTTFEPCNHRSCKSCIDRHLLNNKQCFFCKADIVSTRRD